MHCCRFHSLSTDFRAMADSTLLLILPAVTFVIAYSSINVFSLCVTWYLTAAVLSIPHILYYSIWTNPRRFQALYKTDVAIRKESGTKSLRVTEFFMMIATSLKCIQMLVIITFIKKLTGSFLPPFNFNFSKLVAVVLLGVGQSLNAGIYNAIGVDGVYYGVRLGYKIPWYKGFPFEFLGFPIYHPQYIGAVLSIWGLAFFFELQAFPMALYLFTTWTFYYIITAIVEDSL